MVALRASWSYVVTHELRFSSANGVGLFTADVMFIYIFTKNELDLTHRDCLLYTSDAADE